MTYISGGSVQLAGTPALLDLPGTAAPALSASSHGRIYYDSGTNLFKVSMNGSAFATLGGGSAAGSTTQLQYNNSGAFTGASGLTTDGTSLTIGVANSSGSNLLITTAAISGSPTGGNLTLTTGDSANGNPQGGSITLSCGQGTAGDIHGGSVTLTSGVQTGGQNPFASSYGGGITLTSGTAAYTSGGGSITLTSGQGAQGGSGGNSSGGSITLTAFTPSTGGSITLTGTGTNGFINLANAMDYTGASAPAASASGHGRLYFDSTSNTFKVSKNAGAYATLADGSTAAFSASGGTITANATVASTILVTVDAVATINGPTSGFNGQKVLYRLAQDGTGHTVTFSTGAGNFSFGTDVTSFTASAANLTDYVGTIYNSTSNRWNIIGVVKGF